MCLWHKEWSQQPRRSVESTSEETQKGSSGAQQRSPGIHPKCRHLQRLCFHQRDEHHIEDLEWRTQLKQRSPEKAEGGIIWSSQKSKLETSNFPIIKELEATPNRRRQLMDHRSAVLNSLVNCNNCTMIVRRHYRIQNTEYLESNYGLAVLAACQYHASYVRCHSIIPIM